MTEVETILPTEVGLEIVGAFRRAHIPGSYDWQITFPKTIASRVNPILSLSYSHYSSIVWALLNSVNDDRLPYADRKSAYSTLDDLAENFGIVLPAFKISGYPDVDR